jgi:hypothetical protein
MHVRFPLQVLLTSAGGAFGLVDLLRLGDNILLNILYLTFESLR